MFSYVDRTGGHCRFVFYRSASYEEKMHGPPQNFRTYKCKYSVLKMIEHYEFTKYTYEFYKYNKTTGRSNINL